MHVLNHPCKTKANTRMNVFFFLNQVCWEEESGGNDKTTDTYESKEIYFSFPSVLWGNPQCSYDDPPSLPAGSYSWPFEFSLPHDVPTSFEAPGFFKGYVRYYSKVTIGKMTTHDGKIDDWI